MDRPFIAYFKLAHGLFNLCMLFLFSWQGWMGHRIRRARRTGAPTPLDLVRRHRTAGPVFALWGALGFVAGMSVVLLDKGRVLEYPLHFLVGAAIVSCIAALSAVSRRIAGQEPRYRDIHFRLGMLLLALYIVQVLLGLGILL